MSNPDCTAGCGFICTCGDIDYSRENELAEETTRIRQQLEIAVGALESISKNETMPSRVLVCPRIDGRAYEAKQALAQIRELEK